MIEDKEVTLRTFFAIGLIVVVLLLASGNFADFIFNEVKAENHSQETVVKHRIAVLP